MYLIIAHYGFESARFLNQKIEENHLWVTAMGISCGNCFSEAVESDPHHIYVAFVMNYNKSNKHIRLYHFFLKDNLDTARKDMLKTRGLWATSLIWETVPINKHICAKLWLYHKKYLEKENHILLVENQMVLNTLKLKSPSPKSAFCQVWFKLAQWF